MQGFKPSQRIWTKVNDAIMGENAASVLVTMISGLCGLLVQSGVCADETQARAHLAAMILSPEGAPPGSLVPLLGAELERFNDGKWLT